MKYRGGFVSNSSSANFIVKGKNTKEVAEEMLQILEFDDLVENLSRMENDNDPIEISLYFGDTHIFPAIGEQVYVETIRRDWSELDILEYFDEERPVFETERIMKASKQLWFNASGYYMESVSDLFY